jgi:RpiR family transcriptional regulator, carbohydrate utilization regulator
MSFSHSIGCAHVASKTSATAPGLEESRVPRVTKKNSLPARKLELSTGLLTRLRHLHSSLPPKIGRLAAFILEHANDVIRMTITEVAEGSGTAEGTVVNLCRRLGVSGFQELKIMLTRDLVEPIQAIHQDIREGDSFDVVADRIFTSHSTSLAETRRLLSGGTLDAAVQAINKAKRIEIYGVGSSAPIAQDLAYRLLQLGLAAYAIVDSHIQAVAAAMTGPSVTTITVSHTASTIETVTATRYAKEAGARTIGITRLGKSPLQKYCDILLHTVANETKYRPEAMSSRVAQLAVIDTLVSCCALSNSKNAIAKLQLSTRVLSGKRY